MKKLLTKLVAYHTDADAGHVRTPMTVLGLGAVGIPVVLFILLAFIWS